MLSYWKNVKPIDNVANYTEFLFQVFPKFLDFTSCYRSQKQNFFPHVFAICMVWIYENFCLFVDYIHLFFVE